MLTKDALRLTEEKIYQQYSKDGALLAGIGLFYLLFGGFLIVGFALLEPMQFVRLLAVYYGYAIFVVVATAFVILLIWQWRRRFTFPRLGYSKAIAWRNLPKRWTIRFIILVFVLDGLFAFSLSKAYALAAGAIPPPDELIEFMRVSGYAIGTSLPAAGLILGMKQLSWIVAAMVGMIWLTVYVPVTSGWVIALTGALLIYLGVERLRSFLREYPLGANADAQG